MSTAGLLLAAGAGRRFGRPKALVESGGERFVQRGLRTLVDGGCEPVHVVLGAGAGEARALLPEDTVTVEAADWASGLGASLRAGLDSLHTVDRQVQAVLVQLVDLPWVGPEIVTRLRRLSAADVVARAAYAGVPGHPVLLGRRWWAEIAEGAVGDRGARDWLAARPDLRLVECADLGSGADVDTPADLPDP
ncbi:nicotine blue oxidoreductase [Amycolatopsis marina]|uniref:Nicotine blue oxidoreductase n=1 Tax=Amycolatopsis marina TaxID=490629 RepID=A0A1I0WQF4_9PSEU|nr:nucleotidyltransferase family protein [Amycolatopsis marina]SFA90774.1 nicotine blue oxidoreductase [Amycolatopsis marina]